MGVGSRICYHCCESILGSHSNLPSTIHLHGPLAGSCLQGMAPLGACALLLPSDARLEFAEAEVLTLDQVRALVLGTEAQLAQPPARLNQKGPARVPAYPHLTVGNSPGDDLAKLQS